VDRQLGERIRETICEEWERIRPGVLHSKTIYERLRAEGEEIPPGAMAEYLSMLRDGGLIRAALPSGRSEIQQHGNFYISDVDPDLCD
jgi:hypothetical protein